MSKEIIDKINNNLIMLVEGFDDAERDYGYDLANEKHYVSELIELVKNLSFSGVSNRLNEGTLEEINTIMWESHMVKSRTFDRTQGTMIMKELERWAKR